MRSLEQQVKTHIMYHGTTKTNSTAPAQWFLTVCVDGMLGRGVYLSRDMNKASRYPSNCRLLDSERVVIMVMVNVGNVIAINS